MTQDAKAEIAGLIQQMTDTWRKGACDELDRFFHPDVVLLPPYGGDRIEGRDAMVDTFREFVESATTHDFEIMELTVDLTGPTAVAVLEFRVDYELDGERFEETGRDILVLTQQESWVIVWRTQIAGT